MKKSIQLLLMGVISALISCQQGPLTNLYDFNGINDRIWIGEEFWTVPLEDWRVHQGRVECIGNEQQSTFTILTSLMNEKDESFEISFDLGMIEKGVNDGSVGLIIGSEALEDADYRAAIYFGKGVSMGISTEGYAFLEQQTMELPENLDYQNLKIKAVGEKTGSAYEVRFLIQDVQNQEIAQLSLTIEKPLKGIVQLVNNFRNAASKKNGPKFWFDNLQLKGAKFTAQPQNSFGPILWTMHTLSNKTLKLSAQLPPVGVADPQEVELQFKEGDHWVSAEKQTINPDARTATFKIENWDATTEKSYRVIYPSTDVFGKEQIATYDGTIRKDPVDRPLNLGALTCQFFSGFPYSPLVKNLGLKSPDLLYFSGDQIYEGNGGYPIKRFPEDTAILSYLGKWYMFGWVFGDLMRDVPTVCTPDDHDVFQGNLWGGEGVAKAPEIIQTDDRTGFAQTPKMVNAVNRTQCAHLPDPFDPQTIGEGMSVWYTSMNYGRISFAIVSDRIFKSGPDEVSTWKGRKDHIKAAIAQQLIEKQGLEFLGKRQEAFLNNWIGDWKEVDMKVMLSQTVFANTATHHGQFNAYLYGDMDSGGWPKSGRDQVIEIMQKGCVFQIAGDQHLPSLVQYGLENFRDAGWCYCTPAISIVYSRWFRPDELGLPVSNRPEHGLPNTGEYKDSFGNLNYVYAVGNPGNFVKGPNRYEFEQDKSAGFGFLMLDQKERTIKMESWRFLADVSNPAPNDQHPGWPLTISQFDNDGREAVAWLPTLQIEGEANPVIEVLNQTNGEREYMVRIKGNEYAPKVFGPGKYTVKIGYPEKDSWKTLENLSGSTQKDAQKLSVGL